MTKVQNFSENLENSLVKLGHEVSKKLESVDNKDIEEKEILKRHFQIMASREERAPSKTREIPSAPTASPIPASNEDFLPTYLSNNSDAKKTVEDLLQIAVSDDIEKAVREARKYPPFVEDAFHDALVEKFLPELKKRGIIK